MQAVGSSTLRLPQLTGAPLVWVAAPARHECTQKSDIEGKGKGRRVQSKMNGVDAESSGAGGTHHRGWAGERRPPQTLRCGTSLLAAQFALDCDFTGLTCSPVAARARSTANMAGDMSQCAGPVDGSPGVDYNRVCYASRLQQGNVEGGASRASRKMRATQAELSLPRRAGQQAISPSGEAFRVLFGCRTLSIYPGKSLQTHPRFATDDWR
jgi:hypothetical protein